MNALSATVTAIVVLIFLIVKFKEGAWIIAVIGPLMYCGLIRLNKQYVREERAFEAVSGRDATMNIRMNRVVVFVDTYDLADRASAAVLRVAQRLLGARGALRHRPDRDQASRGEAGAGRAPRRPASPSRSSSARTVAWIAPPSRWSPTTVRDPDVFCMVILPRRGFVSRLQRLLHDRTADAIAGAAMHVPRTAATIIPYRALRRHVPEGDVAEEPASDEVVRGGVREAPTSTPT